MTTLSDSAGGAEPRSGGVAMAILLIAGFMNLIDVTIVNVALPSMQADFGARSAQIEWVVAAYIFVFALGLLPCGRLGDILGRRKMFLWGVAVFTLGSSLCGVAPSIDALVGARVLQAVGAAMMTPQTLAIVPALYAPEKRGAAYALFSLTASLAAVTGPLIGGTLIEADIWGLGWRPIFLVNVPVGIGAIIAALRYVPVVPGTHRLRNDYPGNLIAAAALFCVIFPLIEGREAGWPLWCFAMLATSVPLGVLFVLWQALQDRRGGPQLLPMALIRNGRFMVGSLMAMTLSSGIPGFFLVFAIYLQKGFGFSPLHSGMTTVPFSLGVLCASLLSGRLGARFQRRRITVGGVMMCIGILGLRLIVQGNEEAIQRLAMAPPLFFAGLGLGTTISPLFQTVLSNVPPQDSGSASGSIQAFQQVGGAFGVAVMGEIYFSRLGAMAAGGAGTGPSHAAALLDASLYNAAAFFVVALMVWLLPRPGAAD